MQQVANFNSRTGDTTKILGSDQLKVLFAPVDDSAATPNGCEAIILD